MNLSCVLFLSCNGQIPKTPAQKRKEKRAELKREVEAFNNAAKCEIKQQLRNWLSLPRTRLARTLLRLYTPIRLKRLQNKLVWMQLYHEKLYPENYYDRTGTEK